MTVIRRRKGVEKRIGKTIPTKVGQSVKRDGYGTALGIRFDAGTLGQKRAKKKWGPRSPEKGEVKPNATVHKAAGPKFEKATEWLPKVKKSNIQEFYERIR